MSSRRGQVGLRIAAGAFSLALCGALAATALGFVDIYVNPFSKAGQYRQVSPAAKSNRCDRDFVKKRGVMEVTVKSGPKACAFEPPVQGDAARPDHRFQASGRILKTTNENIRDDAYLSIAVRVGGGKRYELRVFPKGRRFVLRRQPGSGAFPVSGSDPAIGTPGQLNKLRLTAVGGRVRAHVNGAKVADVTDGNPSQVSGRKLEFAVGTEAGSNKNTDGSFDRLALSVPNP